MGGRFEREGTYVYLWLIHVDVWQKPAQYCKSIILQLKTNFNKEMRFVLPEVEGERGGMRQKGELDKACQKVETSSYK